MMLWVWVYGFIWFFGILFWGWGLGFYFFYGKLLCVVVVGLYCVI